MSYLKPIARSVKDVTSKVCQKKFISLGRVLDNWSDIIGEEMAIHAEPAAISVHRKGQGKNATYDKTLKISVAPAHSTALSYRKGMILERINRVLPREGIVDVIFVSSTKKIEKTRKEKKKPLSEDEKNYLSSVLDDMEDDEIKERLQSMGKSFLNKKNEQGK
jgi:hypothetical protein